MKFVKVFLALFSLILLGLFFRFSYLLIKPDSDIRSERELLIKRVDTKEVKKKKVVIESNNSKLYEYFIEKGNCLTSYTVKLLTKKFTKNILISKTTEEYCILNNREFDFDETILAKIFKEWNVHEVRKFKFKVTEKSTYPKKDYLRQLLLKSGFVSLSQSKEKDYISITVEVLSNESI